MIEFIWSLIIGFLKSGFFVVFLIGWFFIEIWYRFKKKPKNPETKPVKFKLFRKNVEILETPDPEVEALTELYEENKKKGIDTKL